MAGCPLPNSAKLREAATNRALLYVLAEEIYSDISETYYLSMSKDWQRELRHAISKLKDVRKLEGEVSTAEDAVLYLLQNPIYSAIDYDPEPSPEEIEVGPGEPTWQILANSSLLRLFLPLSACSYSGYRNQSVQPNYIPGF